MKVLSEEKLAEVVRSGRKEQGLSQEELSELTEINLPFIERIEQCNFIPSIVQLESLAKTLEFDVDALFVERKPTSYTSLRREKYSKKEQEGIDQLIHMMTVLRQQAILHRKYLNQDKQTFRVKSQTHPLFHQVILII